MRAGIEPARIDVYRLLCSLARFACTMMVRVSRSDTMPRISGASCSIFPVHRGVRPRVSLIVKRPPSVRACRRANATASAGEIGSAHRSFRCLRRLISGQFGPRPRHCNFARKVFSPPASGLLAPAADAAPKNFLIKVLRFAPAPRGATALNAEDHL